MASNIIAASRDFFHQIVHPLLESEFPQESQQVACGIFGYGSECLGTDDELSRDHHWGLRVDMLMPQNLFTTRAGEMRERIEKK
ncbi:MAG: hypothetical protein O2954_08375, partial [bacterium]|nr:hypothetical protein [bacterium]